MEIKEEIAQALRKMLPSIDAATFKGLAETAFGVLLGTRDDSPISSDEKLAPFKPLYSAILYVVLESSKHSLEPVELSSHLEEILVSSSSSSSSPYSDKIALLVGIYEKRREALRKNVLSPKISHFQNLVDLDWRLDYNIKSNTLQKTSEPFYTIKLKTQKGSIEGGREGGSEAKIDFLF